MHKNLHLPIFEVISQIKDNLLIDNRLIIEAPPGAGKTTTVPLELIDEVWCKKIIMLEPRRIAARNAAYWMANQLGEKVGQRVGYRVHLDKKISDKTVIEVVTEGVFINQILKDPELREVSLVILDEFHERSINADLSLSLLKESQEILREDLRVVVMSATLESKHLSKYLGYPPLVISKGRSFNVELEHRANSDKGLIADVTNSVIDSINSEKGNILVFLPGVGEIKRVQSSLESLLPKNITLSPLYGALSRENQERAIEEPAPGFRKVVLATSIAESSITIKGVRVVIDSGLIRTPIFNPKNGMESLETLQISQASADQRMGRAGRIENGKCIRLWPSYKKIDDYTTPSILTGDITPLVLKMASSGYNNIDDLTWLTRPSDSLFNSAKSLLKELGAIDDRGITEKGAKISTYPIHPRLASMVFNSEKLGLKPLAALVSGILSERDILHFNRESYQSDIEYRLEAVKNSKSSQIKRVLEYAHSISKGAISTNYSLGAMLISAYPDRVGKSMGDGRFILSSGDEVVISDSDTLYNENFLIIPSAGGTGRLNRVFLAARVTLDEVLSECSSKVKWVTNINYNKDKGRFIGRRELKLNHLILKSENIGRVESNIFRELLISYLKKNGLKNLNWSKEVTSFQNRVCFLNSWNNELFPDISSYKLLEDLTWLSPYLGGLNLKNSLKDIKLLDALKGLFNWDELKQIEEYAPTHIKVPSGSNIPIDYSTKEPVLKVRLQELFGLNKTPSICMGKYALTVHLLSPASRPIQITKDLKSFWDNTYIEVKKDLMGRYPKHHWPEDPYSVKATNRIKR